MSARFGPCLLLAVLGLAFFAPLVLHPSEVLYSDHSDLLAYHIPHKRFLVWACHETGEVPLWCPYNFAGMPFVHDPQVAVFYPFHWPMLLLPESYVGPMLSWLVVLHVVLAGWCMYAYAWGQGLGRAGSLVAALGWMFAGKWLLHLLGAGHYNLTPLAWLPLVLLCLETAIRQRSVLWATGAGFVFALVVLGTLPQLTFYAGLFVTLWTASAIRPGSKRRSDMLAWLLFGLWAALFAVGLSAVQLLPALEAAGLSTRARGMAPGPGAAQDQLNMLLLPGPYLGDVSWDPQGGFAVLWLAGAALALVVCEQRVWWRAFVLLLLLSFAYGMGALLSGLPGFRMFRFPARMLLLAAFPIAFLAGETTRSLVAGLAPAYLRRVRRWFVVVILLVLALPALAVLFSHQTPRWHPYWLSLLSTVPAAVCVLGRPRWAAAWVGVLLIDLWALAWPTLEVRREEAVFAPSVCVRYLAEHTPGTGRILDRGYDGHHASSPLGAGAPLAMLLHLQPVRGYNPLDVAIYKEYLQFIADQDRPLLALDPSNPLTFPVIEDFPVHNYKLLDLLGVTYVIQPEHGDSLMGRWWLPRQSDPKPSSYDFLAGGRQALPAYETWLSADSFPRAFVVPEAEPLPERSQVLAALKQTDFRRVVLLDGFSPEEGGPPAGEYRRAEIALYEPNRVVVRVEGKTAGYLVLTDIWYPGWRCSIDGQPAHLYRADFLFRGVAVPAGTHEVVFSFEPQSYYWGREISVLTVLAVGLLFLRAAVRAWRRAGS